MDILNFVLDPKSDFLGHTLVYLQICAISIVGAVIIGVILGAAVSRNSFLAFIAVNLSGLLRAIPVIATLIVFVPFFGLGLKPALIALIIVGIPPVLLNTYTGVRGVDPAMIDAAKGMGMTTWQIATKIQAPLVIPLVAAGVRTTAVQIVATATLAAFIGAGGYGDYIVDGIAVFNYPELIAGSIAVALFAIIVEVFMGWLQRRVTPAGIRVQDGAEVLKA
ncbi:MAG: ABC transporter permease [Ktedonobacteraceae bacterium]